MIALVVPPPEVPELDDDEELPPEVDVEPLPEVEPEPEPEEDVPLPEPPDEPPDVPEEDELDPPFNLRMNVSMRVVQPKAVSAPNLPSQ